MSGAALYFRNFVYWIAFYLGSIPYVLLAFLSSRIWPDLLMRAVRGWSLFHHACCRTILGIETRVEGEIPDGPFLFAVKHETMFETIDMPRLFNRPAVFAKQELFTIPFWGKAALAYGMIPVDRAGGAAALRDMLRGARSTVKAGRPVVIFPEGTRAPHGATPPLQAGFAGLYKMLGLPVVPIAVNSGARDPTHRGLRSPGVVTYKVGKPIPAGLPRAEIEAKVHAAINALNGSTEAASN